MKITVTTPEHASNFNAITPEGEVVCAGRSMRYALSASPKQAAFIVDAEGNVLAASAGGATWIPTRAGLTLVTAAALALAAEAVAEDDGAAAYEDFVERFDPLDRG